MIPITENEIRDSFVNCSKGEAKRLTIPKLDTRPWENLDFFGWRDPTAHERAYLIAERGDGLVGVALRLSVAANGTRRSLCSVCVTSRQGPGVGLMVAPRVGKAGREGNTIGLRMCSDFACSLYARGLKQPEPGGRFEETLTVDEKVDRLVENLGTFLDRLTK
ncbi:FBP domain-containing protein [Nocardiopsis lambiniae]|uniref:FBP domain-containing protein n=1 Tax=Nocardiopsis lambiniae TaxID=3075539 RepID=A0ABU2MAK0_9ACTN|nr:FBP domain-containing protein [Nocardiopsis sp. DSM 44743]MDT0329693.1 FBP domain-containing protein [Nocardiopsis sp. DSM 44743]